MPVRGVYDCDYDGEAVHARLFARKLRVGLSTFVNGLGMSVVIYFHAYSVVVPLNDGDLGLLDYDFEFSGTYLLPEVHGGGHLGLGGRWLGL